MKVRPARGSDLTFWPKDRVDRAVVANPSTAPSLTTLGREMDTVMDLKTQDRSGCPCTLAVIRDRPERFSVESAQWFSEEDKEQDLTTVNLTTDGYSGRHDMEKRVPFSLSFSRRTLKTRIHLVPSTVHGTYFLRMVVCSQLTTLDDVIFARDVIFEIADRLL